MRKNGFVWRQGSVYVSSESIDGFEASIVIVKLVDRYPWLNACMRDCVVTDVGKEHNLNYLFDKNAEMPKRERKPGIK
jgi:virulence-associated protein VapD